MNLTKEKHATHTPGPWHYSEVIRGRDQYYRQIRADFKIAEVHACHSGVAGTKKGKAEDEANARLIAAAPDLLAQCKEFEKCLTHLINSGDSGADLERDKLREVLAKVEGGEG
jgi:hypothetical protein